MLHKSFQGAPSSLGLAEVDSVPLCFLNSSTLLDLFWHHGFRFQEKKLCETIISSVNHVGSSWAAACHAGQLHTCKHEKHFYHGAVTVYNLVFIHVLDRTVLLCHICDGQE